MIALGIAGLPFTGGGLAKLAVKDALGDGLAGTLGTFSAAASTLLMLHFLFNFRDITAGRRNPATPTPVLPWLAIACAALVVPWALYFTVVGGAIGDIFSTYALWTSIWPMLVGLALMLALQRWGRRLPLVPRGDIIVFARLADPFGSACVDAFVRADTILRRWPVAGLSLLILAMLFGAATFALR